MRLVEVWAAAAWCAIPEETIRTWAKRGAVTAACNVTTRRLLVDIDQVDERRIRRARRHAANPDA